MNEGTRSRYPAYVTDVYIRLQTAQLSRDNSLRSILSQYLTSRLDQHRQLSLRHHDGNANGTRFIHRQQIAVPAEEQYGNVWHDASNGTGRIQTRPYKSETPMVSSFFCFLYAIARLVLRLGWLQARARDHRQSFATGPSKSVGYLSKPCTRKCPRLDKSRGAFVTGSSPE